MLDIKTLTIPEYEKVIEAIDPETGLHCFIALHNCRLGPALGGVRIYPYASREQALEDVLRLAKGMTYKSALLQHGLGGGKSVIIADPKTDKTESLLTSFAQVVASLEGQYIAAEDIGSTPQDMSILAKTTPYVVALPIETSSGNPSRFTAWGVFHAMRAASKNLWGSPSLAGRRISIQGVGSVGTKLAGLLFWEGAELLLTDIDQEKRHRLSVRYGAQELASEDYFATPCDILAPCALGGILNAETIPQLKCHAIVGSANNQLHKPEDGIRLMERGILYAPDYVANAGGIMNVAMELEEGGYDPRIARDRVLTIHDTLLEIFETAKKMFKSTSEVADELAEHNLEHDIGKRTKKIIF